MSRLILILLASMLPVVQTAPTGGAQDGVRRGEPAFHPGTVIAGYGRVAAVEGAAILPEGIELRVEFDVSSGERGRLNRSLDTVARFLNLHAGAGVPLEHLHPAVVVHGTAVFDVVRAERYGAEFDGEANPNAELIAALIEHDVAIYLCGQSAAARGVSKSDLLPGVQLVLSAMTAHALLQQQGYTLNPF